MDIPTEKTVEIVIASEPREIGPVLARINEFLDGSALSHILNVQTVVKELLENAIKHGISPKAEGGSVTIRAKKVAGYLEISVADDGLGEDPEQVENAEGKGLGLLGSRVSTLFDDRGSLTWTTEKGRGFEARLRVPAGASPHPTAGSRAPGPVGAES